MTDPSPRAVSGRIVSRRPDSDELRDSPEYGSNYHRRLIAAVSGDCAINTLEDQLHWVCELAASLSTEQIDRLHRPYEWTVRQVIEHCVDAERIFGARMMRVASGESAELGDWDENACAASRFGLGNFGHLISELGLLRQANVLLLRRIVPRAWENVALISGQTLSLRALAWIAAGHLHHHLEIVEQRCDLRVQRRSDVSSCDNTNLSIAH